MQTIIFSLGVAVVLFAAGVWLGSKPAPRALQKSGTDASVCIVDHSAAVFLINPRGELQALFSVPHDAGLIAIDLLAIIGRDRG